MPDQPDLTVQFLETSKLLQPGNQPSRPGSSLGYGTGNGNISGSGPGSGSGQGLRRPPLFTVPSSSSIKSLKSLNDPVVDRLTDDIIFPEPVFNRFSYISYYLPVLRWLPNYSFKDSFVGDFLAGISIASFQIPLVMSFATSLAHLPPVTGLYSMITGAFVYSLLGSVPVLIVGPAPSLALLYGQLMTNLGDDSKIFSSVEIASAMTASVAAILLAAGIFRFGFLDNVLSRALLKGFLGAMGLIMIISELAPELGMENTPKGLNTIEKLLYAIKNYDKAHTLTLKISTITLGLVMIIRTIKLRLVSRGYKRAIYVPELLLMVSVATFLSWKFEWHTKGGVSIVGNLKSGGKDGLNEIPSPSLPINPLEWRKLSLFKKTFSTVFLCTILGYFDSVIAKKNLGSRFNYNVSANRELVALGATNVVVSILGGMPAFGALGRSKINVMAGATTPMAAVLMGTMTILAVRYLLPFLFYLPECVLALLTTIIGITVLEEVPTDLKFFWSIGGYDEIFNFMIVFLATFFWSAEAGVTLGVGIAVIRIIKKSSKSRIQILGRIPNSTIFRNADELIEESFTSFKPSSDKLSSLISEIEDIEGVLIIKVPEPLNFANVGDLQNRLSRIEKYGSLLVHPSQPQTRDIANIQFIIIDCKGMSAIDSLATQVLYEIVKRYVSEDISICFCRVPIDIRATLSKSGLTKLVNDNFKHRDNPFGSAVGMGNGFFRSIDEALKAGEKHLDV